MDEGPSSADAPGEESVRQNGSEAGGDGADDQSQAANSDGDTGDASASDTASDKAGAVSRLKEMSPILKDLTDPTERKALIQKLSTAALLLKSGDMDGAAKAMKDADDEIANKQPAATNADKPPDQASVTQRLSGLASKTKALADSPDKDAVEAKLNAAASMMSAGNLKGASRAADEAENAINNPGTELPPDKTQLQQRLATLAQQTRRPTIRRTKQPSFPVCRRQDPSLVPAMREALPRRWMMRSGNLEEVAADPSVCRLLVASIAHLEGMRCSDRRAAYSAFAAWKLLTTHD